MIVVYNGFTSEDGQVRWVQREQKSLTPRGYPHKKITRVTLGLFIQSDTQAHLTTAIQAFETAIGSDGHDLTLFLANGTTPSAHLIDDSETFSGTRLVDGPNYPQKYPAEYAAGLTMVGRYVTCTFEGEYDLTAGEDVISWKETVAVIGTGGAEFVILQPLSGAPVKQAVNTATPCTMIQSGRAVGMTTWPTPPASLSSSDEHASQRRVHPETPRETRAHYTEYAISWIYIHERVNSSFSSTTPHNAP